MQCPVCQSLLESVEVEGIQLDVCKNGCGGIWFDRFELQKMDDGHEFTDASLIDVLVVDPPKPVVGDKKKTCPKCQDVIMMQHFYSPKRAVTVDHCPKCAGYWLDHGELLKIRHEYQTEDERKEAAKNYLATMFDDELDGLRKQSAEESAHAHNIANMFRLITPSYYMDKIKKW